MFFKKIEITGFKSFANKTEVLFKPGVTVIVGPNGCGKSNIFDAVRWVLGEQKAKSLRGSKMGDVIFSGTDTHRPTAFAQVTLTVSNDDRRLPIDFNEVVISRRLQRTGESEYFINRHPCRLRDILELFMDTGVGTNAYSIMEQGRIDQIINARPIDRREIFEEAAGVSKYRVRRAEAQRRLARTEDDLIRLADIIAEVKRQATSLKRQANRAERYKRFADELRGIESRLLSHRWRTHQENERVVQEELTAANDRLAEVSARLSRLETDQEKGINHTEELNRHIHEISAQVNEKTAAIHDAEHRVGLLRQRSEINTRRGQELRADLEQNRERLRGLERDLAQLMAERTERERTFATRESAHQAKREECDRLRAGLDQHERELAQMRRNLGDLRTEQINLDNEIRMAALMGGKLSDEMAVINAQREEQSVAAENAKRALAEREEAHGTESARLAELIERRETVQARMDDLKDERSEVDEALQVCQADLAQTQSHLRALRALQQSFEGYREGVRRVMQAVESGELTGVLGTLASQMRPHRDHETAIEAALAGDEQVIVTRSAADRDAALSWLRGQGEGRATFLALDTVAITDRSADVVRSHDEAIAWADDVIECDDEIRPAMRALLGETLIVTDLDAALRLSAQGVANRCVTPKGEMAVAGTRVTAGSFQLSGLISREREIAESGERAERLEQEAEGLIKRREALINSRAEIEAERSDLVNQTQRLEIRLAELGKDLQMAKREADSVGQMLGRLGNRAEDLQRQIEEQLDTRERAAERRDEVRAEITAQEEHLHEAEGTSVSQSAEALRLNEEVQALAIEVARAREQLETLRMRQRSIEAERTEMKHRIQTGETECDRLDEENAEAGEQMQRLEESLAQLFEERRTLEDQANEHRSESDRAGMELKRLGQEIHVVTRERNELQNRHTDLEVRLGQHRMHLEQCDIEAQEKFSIPMADILKSNPEPVEDPAPLRTQALELRQRMEAMGPVNVIAIEEYQQLRERQEFLTTQESDLLEAEKNLNQTITELDKTTAQIFAESFEKIRTAFQSMFRRLFGGGRADLIATEPENLVDSGIDIIAQPPGKKLQSISLLSGGEKALTAIALMFGIFAQKPAPFCVLDEIDAPLDDENVGRFKDLLVEFSQTTQFIIITHNKLTMQLADIIFGITMEERGVSRIVGVDIHTASQYAA